MADIDLEDFEAEEVDVAVAPEPPAPDPVSEAEIEAQRVTAYEEGYKSGWDDAVRQTEEEGRRVGEELARNLRDLAFTYFEARSEVLTALEGFLGELFDKLFPQLLPEAVAASVLSELRQLADTASDVGMKLYVAPEDAATVRSLLPQDGPRVDVVEEAALASGQARIHAAAGTVTIDADRLVRSLRDVISPGPGLGRQAHG